jgi:hypothetical protein
MSIEVVNGYACHSCSDVSLAKKGVNPAHPTDNPSNPASEINKAKGAGATPAVLFGGALAGLNPPGVGSTGHVSASSATGSQYSPGTLLNVSA